MQFWIRCTRAGSGDEYYVNISLVGGMRRAGDRTVLEFVGSDAQFVEVLETPEAILIIHNGASSASS